MRSNVETRRNEYSIDRFDLKKPLRACNNEIVMWLGYAFNSFNDDARLLRSDIVCLKVT